MSLSRILFSYEGRIPRSTFWYYVVGAAIVWVAARFADTVLGATTGAGTNGYGCFTVFLALLQIATGLAVGAKRCHDIDRSGWYLLWGLIPILGDLWLLYQLGFIKGTVGQNLYGPDPLSGNQHAATAA